MTMSGVDERDMRPPFMEMLRRSFSAWWRGIIGLPVLFGGVFVLLTVFWLLENAFGSRLVHQVVAQWEFSTLALRLVQTVITGALIQPLSIALQLLTLRQIKPDRRAIARAFPAYYAWGTLLNVTGLLAVNPSILVRVFKVDSGIAFGGALLVMLLWAAVEARLWLIFPAAALNVRTGFLHRAAESWAQTRGNFWYIFGILLLLTLVLIVPLGVLQYLESASGMYYALLGPDRIFTVSAILVAATSAARSMLNETLTAAAGACFYRALVEGGGPADVEGTAAHFT